MSDCCGDYYAEATVKGATLDEVRNAVASLIDPAEDMDTVEQREDGVYVRLYTAGHDLYVSDAYRLKHLLECDLRDFKEAHPGLAYDVRLYVYQYEWTEVF
jgi:hypothetical protein